MEYNLKQENRKKYQDKTKLKRHHKKDYSKVLKAPKAEAVEEEEEEESEEDCDEDGNVIEKLDEEGNVIPRRKKKLQGNEWRYKEELTIEGLDNDDELISQLDFKKLSTREIDLGTKRKTLGEMSKDELLSFKFVDSKYDKEKTLSKPMDELDVLLAMPPKKASIEPETKSLASHTPLQLKSDEAFLDDLL
jgi:hypothetical protein